MSRDLFHVSPVDNKRSILSSGLRPSPAPESPCGMGVYLEGDVQSAEDWIARLRNERDYLFYADFAVFRVRVLMKVSLWMMFTRFHIYLASCFVQKRIFLHRRLRLKPRVGFEPTNIPSAVGAVRPDSGTLAQSGHRRI